MIQKGRLCSEGTKVSILLVDDRPENLLTLDMLLGGDGLNIVCASSGEEALERLVEMPFACVLLDMRMPGGMGGLETAAKIREQGGARSVPIIFMTALEQSEEMMLKSFLLGATDFLFKPFSLKELKAKVDVLVDLFQRAMELGYI